MLNKGVIDISHWNPVSSFSAAKADGVVGVIHKVTESTNYVDPTYNQNKKAAQAAGLLWGAYHFLRPGNMQAQAEYMVNKLGEEIDLYAADHEDTGVSLDDLKEFCAALIGLTGKTPIIYSGYVLKEQMAGMGRDEELAQYRLWLAQYTSGTPTWPKETWPHWWLWQWSEDGDCAGIGGDVDLNKYDGTADQLRQEWTGEAPEPAPEALEVVISVTAPKGVTVKVLVNDHTS